MRSHTFSSLGFQGIEEVQTGFPSQFAAEGLFKVEAHSLCIGPVEVARRVKRSVNMFARLSGWANVLVVEEDLPCSLELEDLGVWRDGTIFQARRKWAESYLSAFEQRHLGWFAIALLLKGLDSSPSS